MLCYSMAALGSCYLNQAIYTDALIVSATIITEIKKKLHLNLHLALEQNIKRLEVHTVVIIISAFIVSKISSLVWA